MSMAVAKTYEKMALVGDPFKENGKMYVNVQAPKGIKKVRWYTDAEYRRMYPNATIVNDTMNFDARHAFGFGEEGFITLYKGRNLENWADDEHDHLRYNLTFDYYTPGRMELPNLINGIIPIKLMWEQVAAEGNKMKPHEEVRKIVDSLIKDESTSVYQGQVDEWIQKDVTVIEKKSQDGRFGESHTYTLADAENNLYVWKTGTKNYSLDMAISLKMKVKEHKEIGNDKVTVVWYCKEV
jgi:hypothetical protein